MNKKTTNIIKYSLSGILAFVLLWIAFRSVDWKAFWVDLQQTRWGWMVLFFVAATLALVFRERRWTALMRPLDPELRRLHVWDSINTGNLVNVALPGAGEFVRCGYVSSKRMSFDKALGTIACERLSDVVAVIILLIVALASKWSRFGPFFLENVWMPLAGRAGGSFPWLLAGVVLLIAALIWAVFRFRGRVRFFGLIAEKLKGLGTGFASIAKMERKLPFILSTVGIWAMYIATMWCTVRAIPMLDSLSFTDVLFLSAVSNIASVIPVPGGIGAYHYLMALSAQSLYDASWETGILMATLGHESHAILIIVVGVLSYVHITLQRKK